MSESKDFGMRAVGTAYRAAAAERSPSRPALLVRFFLRKEVSTVAFALVALRGCRGEEIWRRLEAAGRIGLNRGKVTVYNKGEGGDRKRAEAQVPGKAAIAERARFVITVLVALSAASSAALQGCGSGSGDEGRSGGERVVRLLNWKDFTDASLLSEFQDETGIRVELHEYLTSQELIAELQSNPDSYDIIVMDAYLIPLLWDLRLLDAIDPERLPGLSALKDEFRRLPLHDYEGDKSVPYLWGTTGMVVNTDFVPEGTDSWKVFWDGRYGGRAALLDDTREAMMPILYSCGFSANSRDPAELRVAEQRALELKANGVRLGETFENIEGVVSGDLWVAEAYGGDVDLVARGKRNIRYVLPKEGFNVWVDVFALCRGAANSDEAHQLIEFFLRPDVSARAALSLRYGTPVEEAEILMRVSDDYDPTVFPQDWQLEQGEFYVELKGANREYERIFQLLR